MALTGEAKKIYQRNYMRKRRSVRPTGIALLDQTLDDCTKGLRNTNNNLREVIRMAEEILDPNEAEEVEKARDDQTQTLNTEELQGGAIVTGIIPAEEPSEEPKSAICTTCNGRGFIELDRIGLVCGPCSDCTKRELRLEDMPAL